MTDLDTTTLVHRLTLIGVARLDLGSRRLAGIRPLSGIRPLAALSGARSRQIPSSSSVFPASLGP